MPTTKLTSVALALEGAFGALSATTKLPDPTTLTFVGMGAERATFFEGMSEPVNEMDLTRSGSHHYAHEPETVLNQTGVDQFGAADGEPIRRMMGEITLRKRLNNIGGGLRYPTHDAHPLFQLLSTAMKAVTPATPSVDSAGIAADVNTIPVDVADIGKFEVGLVVAVIVNNAVEFTRITKVDAVGNALTVSPAFSVILPDATTVRLCYTLVPFEGSTLPTAALRFDMDGRRMYAFGCRMSALKLAFENETMVAEMTVQPAVVLRDDTAAATISWTPADGTPAQWLQSYHLRSDTTVASGSKPGALARKALNLVKGGWDVELAFEVDPEAGGADSILGMPGQEVMSSEVTLNLRGNPDDALGNMLRLRNEYQFALGCGPAGPGQGMAFFLNAGHARESAPIGEGDKGRQLQSVSLRNGEWALDDGTGALANKSFTLAFPL